MQYFYSGGSGPVQYKIKGIDFLKENIPLYSTHAVEEYVEKWLLERE